MHTGGARDVAEHLLPEVAELVSNIPDVIAGGGECALPGAGVIAGAA
jgi:hypothetical protein